MATVLLTDIYEAKTFEALINEKATEKNALVKSGVVVEDARLTAMAATGGRHGDLPNFAPITHDEPNYSTDNPLASSTPANIANQTQRWRLAAMNKSWSAMDLSRELSLTDPIQAITDGVGEYWATVEQKRVIYSCLGIMADNDANDNDDMIYNIATDDAGAITDAERISGNAVVMASATIGDRQTEFAVIAMHSMVFAQLRKNNLIDYIPESEGKMPLPYYLGMLVIVDDGMPAISGVNRITYTSILFKAGAFAMGTGTPESPSELERKASTGDGGGETILHSRMSKIVHPWGMDFTSANVAVNGYSATMAELALAANWNRIYERKNVGIAFLKTNG